MSEATKTYNGWTNYETWAVNLWLSNEEGSYHYWGGVADDCWESAEAEENWTRKENAQLDLAARLKSEHEEFTPELSGVWGDLLTAALSEVNWHEIAGGLLEDYEDDQDAE